MTEEMNQIDVQVPEVGDVVKGIVTKVEDKHVDVEIINVKQSGIIPISELSSLHVEKASDVVNVDDELDLKVTKVEDDALILSKRAVDADRAWEDLEKKFETKEVFEAEVKDVVKGGLVVDIGVRGFIPASLVEAHFVEDFTDYKGKTLSLIVVELDRDKNRVILSHRAVVEKEQTAKKHDFLQTLEVGSVLEGKVQRLTDFGAFVDIGGIDGLVHISQLSHSHVEKPSDVVEEGQDVKVKVLSVDRDNERISLSIKETLPGPWSQIGEKVKQGDVLEGKVQRLVSFGAFVEILPGVEGLVHISQISNKHIGTPHEVLEEGQTVKVKVLDVNESEERISLSMRELEEAPKADQEDFRQYQAKEEPSTGFQLGDLIGDKLNKLK
ncbi:MULTISPECIES: 30S ribosomal protein S1 [Bacillus]|uniref:Small ribosomal subunit protein bS1 homolog n=2 Tax=Bacillus amyloliquefaciens group TaxID=1938374 RepID=A0A9P1NIC1_BACAS|nr:MULTISPECIES: 30S ribosomal protein S1 [Bacillus amyloliquefaciens group]AIW34243.1 30S ribosomal protein S1 [Bacillus subtilis]AEB64005.1 RNA degradation presenting factor [Bacillus amyloliquefaciens LL3]ARW39452.1 30S ribosomal protein S1 like protein [Bacillus amyloliquefaciens]ASF29256.1 30S ribosomal protein S1 [Bacillus amyloliquefaciens]AZV89660.1 30S ribosomal protein S1 [Bacillus amyloliquefaciens]